jgi:hypothetical protein
VPSRCQIRPLGQRVAVPMSSAKTNAQLSNAVLGTMPVPTNATLKTTSRIVAAPPSTKAPSTTELSETLQTAAIPAFIKESDFMADLCKAKLRVPRQLVRLLRDGALRAGSAPYGAKGVATRTLQFRLVPLRRDGAFQAGNAPYARSALLGRS